jgi:uncharacterized protein with NRDE domain
MCLIAFAWGASERFPFVVAANRDEFYERPTAPLAQWHTASGATVVSGRDLKDGGTWMGFSPNGRFAMLTNVRNPQAAPPQEPISRGHLALSWLETQLGAQDWIEQLQAERYQGFNLIIGDWHQHQCMYVSNQAFYGSFPALAHIESAQDAPKLIATDLPTGSVYGLSNAALDTPWPKTTALKTALQAAIDQAKTLDDIHQICLRALRQTTPPEEQDIPKTGVPWELERALASAFVRYPAHDEPHYGTRSSLVAVLDANQRESDALDLTEWTHSAQVVAHQSIQARLDWR